MVDADSQSASSRADLLDTSAAGAAAVRGGTIRVVGYGAGVLLTVVSAALLFRHLGVVDTGRYVTVLALITIVSGVTDIGLTTIGMREVATLDRVAGQALMRDLLGLRLVLAIGGVGAVTLFAVVAGYDSAMVIGTALAGISVIAASVQSTLGIVLMVQLRLGWLTLVELLRQGLLVAAVVLLVVADAGLLPFLAIQGIPTIVALIVTARVARREVPLVPAFHVRRWARLLREVLPVSAATIVVTIYFRAALIVLGLVSTEAQTGYFGAAFRITEALLLLPGLMVGAAFPIFSRAARDDHERLAYGVDRVFAATLVAGAGMMVALVLGAPFAIDVVAGPRFAESASVLRLQAVALMISFVATTVFYALLSLRRHSAILATACTALAVNIVLAMVLGGAHGARGAALGTLVAELAAFGVAMTLLARSDRHVVPGLWVVPRVAVAVAVAATVLLIPGLPSVAAAVIGTAIYAAAALAVGAVPRELLDVLPRRRALS